MASSAGIRRLRKEYIRIEKEPLEGIFAAPLESNILEWIFVLVGPKETPFEGGLYMGKLKFPKEYPLKPPSVIMLTPSGRFRTNTRICMSMTDFHPESWNPLWSVGSILTGIRSFMVSSEVTHGSMSSSADLRTSLARSSVTWTQEQPEFEQLFGENPAVRQSIAACRQYWSDKEMEIKKTASPNHNSSPSVSSSLLSHKSDVGEKGGLRTEALSCVLLIVGVLVACLGAVLYPMVM